MAAREQREVAQAKQLDVERRPHLRVPRPCAAISITNPRQSGAGDHIHQEMLARDQGADHDAGNPGDQQEPAPARGAGRERQRGRHREGHVQRW